MPARPAPTPALRLAFRPLSGRRPFVFSAGMVVSRFICPNGRPAPHLIKIDASMLAAPIPHHENERRRVLRAAHCAGVTRKIRLDRIASGKTARSVWQGSRKIQQQVKQTAEASLQQARPMPDDDK